MDEYPIQWETVSTHENLTTFRIRVPGGWLVVIRDAVTSFTVSQFVGDPTHNWPLTT